MSIDILKRLHHREPYLMVDNVIEHSSDFLIAMKTPKSHEYYLQGHFPGAPIVPGAMMQEMTTQAAGLIIAEYHSPVHDYNSETTKGYALGVVRTIHHAKFNSFARAGDALTINVELIQKIDNMYRFVGGISRDGKRLMTNEFTLMNISDDKLFA